MENIIITQNMQGQRLDKMLLRYLPNAGLSFICKMLRKKNITLNDKKADGSIILKENDSVKIYFSDETLKAFKGSSLNNTRYVPANAFQPDKFSKHILFENEDLIVCNKPFGLLTQKAKPSDISLNEMCLQYMQDSGQLINRELFVPSVMNRLDRNTGGIVLFAKTLPCAKAISECLTNHSVCKYYYAIVLGKLTKPLELKQYLYKDTKTNKVHIYDEKRDHSVFIHTIVTPISHNNECSLIKVQLLTGKSHQIRAALSHIGHPLLGDAKYGNREINRTLCKNAGIPEQFLFAYQVKLPQTELSSISGLQITAELPSEFKEIMNHGNMEQ